MGEKTDVERLAVVETLLEKQVLPMMMKIDEKLDQMRSEAASKESVKEAHRRIDKTNEEVDVLTVAMEGKADKTELHAVRDRVLIWSGGLAVLVVVVGWLVPWLMGKV